MKTTVERELKFEGEDVQIEELGGEPIEPHIFRPATTTPTDRRLLRAGITLRRRVENGVEPLAAEAAESTGAASSWRSPGGPAVAAALSRAGCSRGSSGARSSS